jgi:hypothetical protein
MNPRIRQFLDELYAVDPALRTHEAELVPVIEHLLARDPGREPDAAFVEELRGTLQRRAIQLKGASVPSGSFWNRLLPVAYVLGGAAVTAAVVLNVHPGTPPPQNAAGNAAPLFAYQVRDTGKNAFGDLSKAQPGEGGRAGGGGGMATDSAVPATAPTAPAAAQNTAGSAVAAPDAALSEPYGKADMRLMPQGEITQYDYVYAGALPALPTGSVSVLERERGLSRPAFQAIANQFRLGMMDLGSFQNAKVDNVTLSQDEDLGYTVNLMLQDGTMNLSANWLRWPHPEQDCATDACYAKYRTTLGQLLSQEELLKLAGDFVSAHGVDLAHYGAPEVDDSWKREYDAAADKANAYIPDAQTVVYPLLAEGKPVLDQSGQKQGIRVNVNVRQRRVSDVWGIQSLSYLRSDYDAVTGSGQILSYLKTVDAMPADSYPAGTKVKHVKVELDTPEIGYVSELTYDKQVTHELIVPALLFPVKSVASGETVWRKIIAVPLAQELLKQAQPMYRILD